MWLKLTAKTEEENIFYINPDKICLMERNQGYTHLQFDNPGSWARVKETPEEILQMLNFDQISTMCKGVKHKWIGN